MGLAFFDATHTIDKLHNTICIYHGEPYQVVCDDGVSDNLVCIISLKDGVSRSIKYTEDSFDYRAFPLGYINIPEGQVLYLMRQPGRSRSQGLSRGSLMPSITSTTFCSPNMYHCIMGTHEPFEKVLEEMQQSTSIKGRAFHRNGALVRRSRHSLEIHFKGSCIAKVSKGGSIIHEESGNPAFQKRLLMSIGIF